MNEQLSWTEPGAILHSSGLPRERSRSKGWSLEIVVAIVMAFLVWQGTEAWFQSYAGVTHFPQALSWVGIRPVGGYTLVTPALLNREQLGRATVGRTVRYVGPDVPSTGPFIVSVNPIDSFTWAAVARGDNGRCYATLLYSDPMHPQYGGTLYANFPRGTRCTGSIATRQSVTSTNYPQ